MRHKNIGSYEEEVRRRCTHGWGICARCDDFGARDRSERLAAAWETEKVWSAWLS